MPRGSTHPLEASSEGRLVLRGETAPSPHAPSAISAVHFSVVYRLRTPVISITQRTAQTQQITGATASTSPSPLPSVERIMWREAVAQRQAAGDTVLDTTRTSTAVTSDSNFIKRSRHMRTSGTDALRRGSANVQTIPRHSASDTMHGQSTTDPGLLPLSTFDLRELSKVVLRDALFSQLLDVVPSRACIRCAVWHLSAELVQMDGVVAVLGERSMPPSSEVHGVRLVSPYWVLDRVSVLSQNPAFFAGVLAPYLGEDGAVGTLENVLVELVRS